MLLIDAIKATPPGEELSLHFTGDEITTVVNKIILPPRLGGDTVDIVISTIDITISPGETTDPEIIPLNLVKFDVESKPFEIDGESTGMNHETLIIGEGILIGNMIEAEFLTEFNSDNFGTLFVINNELDGIVDMVMDGAFVVTVVGGIDCPDDIVAGVSLPIDITTLLLAGLSQNAAWMIPVVLSVLGIGLFVVSRKSENS